MTKTTERRLLLGLAAVGVAVVLGAAQWLETRHARRAEAQRLELLSAVREAKEQRDRIEVILQRIEAGQK